MMSTALSLDLTLASLCALRHLFSTCHRKDLDVSKKDDEDEDAGGEDEEDEPDRQRNVLSPPYLREIRSIERKISADPDYRKVPPPHSFYY